MSKPLQIKSVLESCFIIQQSLLFPNRMAGHLNEMQLNRIFAKTAGDVHHNSNTMWRIVLIIGFAWIYTTCTGYQGNVVTVTNIDLSFFLFCLDHVKHLSTFQTKFKIGGHLSMDT